MNLQISSQSQWPKTEKKSPTQPPNPNQIYLTSTSINKTKQHGQTNESSEKIEDEIKETHNQNQIEILFYQENQANFWRAKKFN